MSPRCGKENLVPREVSRKISPGLLWFAGRPGILLGFTLTGLSFVAPSVHPDRDGFFYLLVPWFCPGVAAIFFTFVPFRPDRGLPTTGDYREVDRQDPVVMRLVALLKSAEARRHIWTRAALYWAILSLVSAILSFVFRQSIRYVPPSPQNHFFLSNNEPFWFVIVMSCLGSYIALWSDYVGWGLKTWAAREAGARAARK